jgi:hypothetical protein
MRARCLGKRHNGFVTVNIGKSAVEGAGRRAEIKQNASENKSRRAAIEGTNSALKRKGLDKLLVRGKTKCVVVRGLEPV